MAPICAGCDDQPAFGCEHPPAARQNLGERGLDAYRGVGGTVVLLIGGALIWGCYLLMRRLGKVPEPQRTGLRADS